MKQCLNHIWHTVRWLLVAKWWSLSVCSEAYSFLSGMADGNAFENLRLLFFPASECFWFSFKSNMFYVVSVLAARRVELATFAATTLPLRFGMVCLQN